MYRRHGQKLCLVFLACDLAVTTCVWMAAYALRFAVWPAPDGIPALTEVLRPLPLVLGLAALTYWQAGFYQIHRLQQLPRELRVVSQASAILFALAITATFYLRELYDSRLALALFFVLNAVALTCARRILWRLLAWFRGRGLNHGRALIVGSGRCGRLVAETLSQNHWIGLETVGYVDQPPLVEPRDLPRLGVLNDLPDIIQKYDVDHLFVALPLSRYGELPSVYERLRDCPVEVHLVPDMPHLAGMKMRLREIDGIPFLGLRENPLQGWQVGIKRAMDVAVAGCAVLIFSPLLLLLAVLVKLSSPGPIFYRQARSGQAGRIFHMLKFRTMCVEAERRTGPVWAQKHDARCTPLGRLMRKLSLDELPQLFNVLRGDMSLVGPRPERPVFVERFRKEIPNYAWRHLVKTGMTGWAQVHGWRGNTSLRRRLEHDLYYITHWSPWLDLQILVLTIWRGFYHRNAG